MKHQSVRVETPIEIIDVTPFNPLISKCQIKVCYVGEQPNRNRSVITKEVATQMANSLPGSPIVGYFNQETNDFEEHNREIQIVDGKLKFIDTTRPYGFVDLNAKVWFQKFLDDNKDEREYLMTEGWLWTEQYPESKRILEKGNNQSMELSEKYTNAFWTKENNENPKLFIINETIISKLCILGEDNEPCFEGAQITSPIIQFSFEDSFKNQLFSMMNELKDLLSKGGAKMFTKYAVEIGDNTWEAVYNSIPENYELEGFYEDEVSKFAVLKSEGKYFRLDFSILDDNSFGISDNLVELSDYNSEGSQFSSEEVAEYAKKKKNEEENKKEEDKTNSEDKNKTDNNSEDTKENNENEDEDEEEKKKKKTQFASEEVCEKCGKPKEECECNKYSLEEIPEYVQLLANYSDLESKYNTLIAEKSEMENQISTLIKFKQEVEKKDKEAMIDSFYMLSEEDKKDVIDNIDTYSLNDIEAKLSIICVRNKVNFDLDDKEPKGPTTYSLEDPTDDTSMPAWVKAALDVAKSK